MQVQGALQHAHATPESANAVSHVAIATHLLTSPIFRPLVATGPFIRQLGGLLRTAWGRNGRVGQYSGLSMQLQHTLDALLHESVLAEQGQAILEHLVPDLCTVRVPDLDDVACIAALLRLPLCCIKSAYVH
jgi:hypothetical protein